jgi:hypothetical protein
MTGDTRYDFVPYMAVGNLSEKDHSCYTGQQMNLDKMRGEFWKQKENGKIRT